MFLPFSLLDKYRNDSKQKVSFNCVLQQSLSDHRIQNQVQILSLQTVFEHVVYHRKVRNPFLSDKFYLNLVIFLYSHAVKSDFVLFSFLGLNLKKSNLFKVHLFKAFSDFFNGLRSFPTRLIKQYKNLDLAVLEIHSVD